MVASGDNVIVQCNAGSGNATEINMCDYGFMAKVVIATKWSKGDYDKIN